MSVQLQAFHMTQIEAAELFRAHFDDLVERRLKAVISANDKLTEARQLRDLAEEQLRKAKAADQATMVGTGGFLAHAAEVAQAGHEIAYVVNSGAADSDGLAVIATVDDVDPVTGEVTTEYDRVCDDCGGAGRLEDRTGGGRHRCKACAGTGKILAAKVTPFVFAVYPGSGDSHKTPVGDRTRYGELVADYFAAAGIDEADDVSEWGVFAEDELDSNGGGGRNLTAVIQERDYGRGLIVAERRAL